MSQGWLLIAGSTVPPHVTHLTEQLIELFQRNHQRMRRTNGAQKHLTDKSNKTLFLHLILSRDDIRVSKEVRKTHNSGTFDVFLSAF